MPADAREHRPNVIRASNRCCALAAALPFSSTCRPLFRKELAFVGFSRFIARRKTREPVPEIVRARPIIEGRFVVSVINVIVKSLVDSRLRPGILRMPETRVGEPTSLYLEYTFAVRLCPVHKTAGLKIALTGENRGVNDT